MRTLTILVAVLLIAGLFVGCGKTTPPGEVTSSPAASPASTVAAGQDKDFAQAYYDEWVVVEGNVNDINKEWNELVAGADKMSKEELAKKMEEHMKKHEELKGKIDGALKEKAASQEARAHQEVIVEIITLQTDTHKKFQDSKKEGIVKEEKDRLDADIKKADEDLKTKMEDAKKKLDEMVTKYEIKPKEGAATEPGASPAASPGDTGAPAASPTGSPSQE
ncbi:MAG: hypothetical protein RDV48_22205 [Candidatus Eremiobacteraeota bacterium]|nr:hypothetical protein [Candidatus Eremiobacteraeota bacterium]